VSLDQLPPWFMSIWPAFAVSGVCLLMEMFFAAAELSVISADRIAVRKDAEAGQRSARLLERHLAVPVLAAVPSYAVPRERRNDRARYALAILLMLGVFAAYALTYWIRTAKVL